jgi:tetratricopeptide (TPR) repeat protein/predicted Ser/Thr protein kinase
MISHYRIIEEIGAGGMGVVYKALDTRLDRAVALKFLPSHLLCDAEARERFEHEAKAASALSHPNIMTIYEIDEVDSQCFIAMEYVDGPSLRELLREKDLSLDEVLDIAIQIAGGLSAAHGENVIHRDLKPANIMVTSRGRIEITDFGLAKLKGVTKLTKTGTTLGTLPYMSPEQVQGKEVDHRSDIFSFGVVLYEMIAGRLPFRGDNEAAIVRSVMGDTPEPLARYKADVPQGLERIVAKALAKDTEHRYQHADDLLADLKHERRASERAQVAWAEREAQAPHSRTKMFRFLAITAVVAAVAVIYLVLEPFRVEVGPQKEAIADENSLAVMYFENVADPEDADKTARMITSLLITDLSESEYMYVVSRQRLYDILNLLGKDGLKAIDKSIASEVAEKVGVKWILTGDILQVEPHMVITSDISEAGTGRILATQRIVGEAGDDIFAVVDKLTKAIKQDMSLPEDAAAEPDRPVADVTTHSPEAYRYYLEGWDYFFKHYTAESTESFRKALEYDSTFAMANWALSYYASEPEKSRLMARAVKYSDRASDHERRYIAAMAARNALEYDQAVEILIETIRRYPDAKQAHLSLGVTYTLYLGDAAKAIPHFRKAVEIDPLYKEAYNQLAYAYDKIGDLDNAIWAINEYIALAPDEANPYDSRGDLYAYNGRIEEALESYRRASAVKPMFSTWKEGNMYLFKRDYARAESCYMDLASSSGKDYRVLGRLALACVPMYRGKLDEALKVLDDGLGADRMEQARGERTAEKYRLVATVYLEKGEFDSAIEAARNRMELRKTIDPNDPGSWIDVYIHVLAEGGQLAEAERLAAPLVERREKDPKSVLQSDWLALGVLERARGNHDQAIIYMTKALEAEAEPYFHLRSILAETYMGVGKLGEAADLFEAALSRYGAGRPLAPIRAAKAYYWLGLAYEQSGWSAKAIEQYETFLEIWKDADPGIAEVEDARQRLAELHATP